jgi:minimal PKS ketosynthase (KS/KS alpha)
VERRVVITGIGVMAPGGVGTKSFWQLLTEGNTATRRVSFFDPSPFRSQVAAEVDFDPEAHGLTARDIRRLDRAAQFSVVCTREAVTDSGLELGETDPTRMGVLLGSAVGATTGLEDEYRVSSNDGELWEVDHEFVSPALYSFLVPSSFASEVARTVGAEGPCSIVSCGCTSGIDAVGNAAELIREGTADVMIAGATDAPISPITVACFDAIKATSVYNDDAEHASRPFDRTRNGFVLAEGAATLVLEERDAALRRGAHVYAEIGGYGTRSNAYHMTGLRADGTELAEAVRVALAEARLDPSTVDYVNAHGSGTKQNDRHETSAIKLGLGPHALDIPVSSIKSMIGHSMGAIGAIEIAACALAIDHDVVPPTANLTEPDPELDLDYVPVTAREWRTDTVLTTGSGFGGFQSAMVLTDRDGSAR